jgi:hypothetical protein
MPDEHFYRHSSILFVNIRKHLKSSENVMHLKGTVARDGLIFHFKGSGVRVRVPVSE